MPIMLNIRRTILITGGAGYVGEMLCDQFSKREDVETIITIDKEPQSDFSKQIPKLIYIQQNLADGNWQDVVLTYQPDSIIHTAWQIRELYGESKEQWRWNIEGSQAVFDFAFKNEFVKKLVYFSTASSYSARVDNSFEHYFTEIEGFRDDEYSYAKEKKVVEENLHSVYEETLSKEKHCPQITVLRPAAITGPRGRFMQIRFGLQSALQGNMNSGFVYKIIKILTTFMPVTKGWVRQFIHEDDVTDIVALSVFTQNNWSYEIFNITPVGEPVFAKDMAEAVGKKVMLIYPWMARLAFWLFWHLTRGKIPTGKGVWRFYSYPILMSGDKLTAIYRCRYSSKDALFYTDGRYQDFVPEHKRNLKLPSK